MRITLRNILGGDKNKMPRDQTLGNGSKDAMPLDCKSVSGALREDLLFFFAFRFSNCRFHEYNSET